MVEALNRGWLTGRSWGRGGLMRGKVRPGCKCKPGCDKWCQGQPVAVLHRVQRSLPAGGGLHSPLSTVTMCSERSGG